MTRVSEIALPEGYRWATGGGSAFGGCNGVHIASSPAIGTLCGKIGPATISPRPDDKVCGSCVRIVKI